MAHEYADVCIAQSTVLISSLTFARGDAPKSTTTEPALTDKEKAGLERTSWFRRVSSGYLMQQSTQPQTLGYSLSDSPAGLLAWIYEKLVTWSDAYPWEDDEGKTTGNVPSPVH